MCLLVRVTIRGIRNLVSSLPSIEATIRGHEGAYVSGEQPLLQSLNHHSLCHVPSLYTHSGRYFEFHVSLIFHLAR